MRKAIEMGTTPHRLVLVGRYIADYFHADPMDLGFWQEKGAEYRDMKQEGEVNATKSLFFTPFNKIPLSIPLKKR